MHPGYDQPHASGADTYCGRLDGLRFRGMRLRANKKATIRPWVTTIHFVFDRSHFCLHDGDICGGQWWLDAVRVVLDGLRGNGRRLSGQKAILSEKDGVLLVMNGWVYEMRYAANIIFSTNKQTNHVFSMTFKFG